MGLTVNVRESQQVRMSDEIIEANLPNQIEFTLERTLSMTEGLLDEFTGSSLQPARVVLSIDGSQTVDIDLDEEASLWLDSVDVGVETPDMEDLASDLESTRPSSDDDIELESSQSGSIAFTVEGVIRDAPDETLEVLTDEPVELDSVQFAVDNLARTDGGSGSDTILELRLLGYSITIFRNGNLEIGPDDSG